MRNHHQLTPGHILRDIGCVIALIVLAGVCVFVIAGCTAVPKDFKPGAPVDPPQGCIDQRARNPKAEC